MNGQLDKIENDLNSKFENFREILLSKQESQSATIDAAVQEFTAWKNSLKGKYEDASQQIEDQLKLLADTNDQKINDLQKDFSVAANKATDVLDDYDKKSKAALADFREQYENMLANVKKSTADQEDYADKKRKELKSRFDKQTDEYMRVYNNAFDKIGEEANKLQFQIDEINKSIGTFKTETSVFDKADILKKQLETSIDDLNKKISAVKNFEEKLNDLSAQAKRLEKFGDDVNSRLNAYSSDKSRLDSIEYKFNTLMNLSSGMDSKIQELTSMSDDILNMQAKVGKFQDSISNVQSKLERIENKKETYDRVAEEVDRSFENISQLEKRLEECSGKVNSLPDEIKSMQNHIDKIMKNSGKINDAVDKITSLQSLIDDAEERIAKIKDSRDGILNTEVRLQKLYSDADSKLKLLHDITAKEVGSKPSAVTGSNITPQLKSNVIKLKKDGWKNAEIAKRLKIEENIVNLILEMGTDE